jgi:hypothetical protein
MPTQPPARPVFAALAEFPSVGVAASRIPPQTLAVIAASVHAILRHRPHRVASVLEVRDALDWAREGRRMIFASHRTR